VSSATLLRSAVESHTHSDGVHKVLAAQLAYRAYDELSMISSRGDPSICPATMKPWSVLEFITESERLYKAACKIDPTRALPDFVRQLTLTRALGPYWSKWVEEERRALRLPTDFTMFVGAIRAHVGALALTATSPGLSHRAGQVDRKIESVAHASTIKMCHISTPLRSATHQRRRRQELLLPQEVLAGHQYRRGTSRALSRNRDAERECPSVGRPLLLLPTPLPSSTRVPPAYLKAGAMALRCPELLLSSPLSARVVGPAKSSCTPNAYSCT
jgi:hypothetical protein